MKIYKITNKINNLTYIGQTKHSLQRRFNAHCNPKNSCAKLIRAIQKYGKENFTIDLLFMSEDQNVIDFKEKEYIQQYDSIKNGYNILAGGRGFVEFKSRKGIISNFKGKTHSEESRKKMKNLHKGVRRNPTTEFKKGQPSVFKGIKTNRSAARKQIIDIHTGYVWQSIKEAAESYNMNAKNLAYLLRKNKTYNLRYVEKAA